MKKTKSLYIFILLIILSLALLFARYIDESITKIQDNILSEINSNSNYNVTINKIKKGFNGISLIVSLADITVIDSNNKNTILTAENIGIECNLWSLLTSNTISVDKVVIDRAEIKIIPQQGGEQIQNIDLFYMYDLLLSVNKLKIKNSNLLFVLQGENLKLTNVNVMAKFIGPEEGYKIEFFSDKNLNFHGFLNKNKLSLHEILLGNSFYERKIIIPSLYLDLFNRKFNIKTSEGDIIGEFLNNKLIINKIGINLVDLISYLPDKYIGAQTMNWLNKAILDGTITNSTVVFTQDDFNIDFDFDGLTLNYDDDWPQLTKTKGSFSFNKKGIKIVVDDATLQDKKVASLIANISWEAVQITGSIYTDLKSGLDFLVASPLKNKIGDKLNENELSGDFTLDLDLLFPFGNKPNQVFGKINLDNVTINNLQLGNKITNIVGDIKFTDRSVFSDVLKFNMLGKNYNSNFEYILFAEQDNLELNIEHLFYSKIIFKEDKIYSGHLVVGEKQKTGWVSSPQFMISGEIPKVYLGGEKKENIEYNKYINFLKKINMPVSVHLLAHDFRIKNLSLGPTWFTVEDNFKKILVDGYKIKGNIYIPKNNSEDVNIKLEKLDLEFNSNEKQVKIDITTIPKLEIGSNLLLDCKNLIVNNKKIGEVVLNLNTNKLGYSIEKLEIISESYLLAAHGAIQAREKPLFNLLGNMIIKNFNDFFQTLSTSNWIDKGAGSIDFDVSFKNKIFDFNTLEADVKVELKKGTLIDVNPGIGKLISLFSFNNLQRRLKLDFSDITEKGFAFDILSGNFEVSNGVISVSSLYIDGPAAKVDISGDTEIENKELNMHMLVTSKVTDSLPLAAAVAAGNPIVGAAVWVFDKTVGFKINEINQYTYKINGTWKNPEFIEIKTSR